MTTLADEIERQIEWTVKNCPNAPYVPIKMEDARAILTALRSAEQVREKAAQVAVAVNLSDQRPGCHGVLSGLPSETPVRSPGRA